MKFLITGGLGFIGTNLIKHLLEEYNHEILNVDKVTYASNFEYRENMSSNKSYNLIKGDICDRDLIRKILDDFNPDFIMNLAAESHVDKSISGPEDFIQTNIIGTFNLLKNTRDYWNKLSIEKRKNFRFLHISTDEVYGSLDNGGLFNELSPYKPNSPYAASKASSDHLVRAWNKTYGLPTIISNCSNNYGPHQYPEKLIPLVILNALNNKPLPIYGDGLQIRDWLHVQDHVKALYKIITRGKIGETYNIGANNQISNIKLVQTICGFLDSEIKNKPKNITSFSELIKFVEDRPGHDICYGIDSEKLCKTLDWKPEIDFERGIEETIKWYVSNNLRYDEIL